MTSSKPLVVAHRGASCEAPENTISSFNLAWEQGADAIECDVWMTRDERLVCIHDKTTARISEHTLDVTKSTLAELKKLDAGNWKDPEWKGEQIPALEEIFSIIPKNKKVFVEIKDKASTVPVLAQAIRNSHLPDDQVVIISFSREVVKKAKETLADIKTLLLLELKSSAGKKKWAPSQDSIIKTLKDINANGLDVANAEGVDKSFVEAIHDAGFEVHVWTVNDEQSFLHYCNLGVDSITTDKPGTMRLI